MQVELKLSLSTILELINATNNTTIATQLFEGTYVEPKIPSSVFNTAKKELVQLVSFDKWTNKVTFTYNKYKYSTEDGKDWSRTESEKYCVKTFDMVDTDSISLETWMSYHNASVEAFAAPKDFAKIAEYASLEDQDQKVVSIPLQD